MDESDALQELFNKVDDFADVGDFASIDSLLADAKPDELTPVMAVALVRCTFSFRKYLPNWRARAESAKASLRERFPDKNLLFGMGL